ncbi:hypothetical protein [Escherichia coli]
MKRNDKILHYRGWVMTPTY